MSCIIYCGVGPSRRRSAGVRNVCYPCTVEITLNIPDELARKITHEGSDPARVALEALALEGYRTERLSESAVHQMLGGRDQDGSACFSEATWGLSPLRYRGFRAGPGNWRKVTRKTSGRNGFRH